MIMMGKSICPKWVKLFQVPLGDKDRLNRLPSLCGQEFTVTNEANFKQATADIQLSSLGNLSLDPECVQLI